jgi:hypothetical protein
MSLYVHDTHMHLDEHPFRSAEEMAISTVLRGLGQGYLAQYISTGAVQASCAKSNLLEARTNIELLPPAYRYLPALTFRLRPEKRPKYASTAWYFIECTSLLVVDKHDTVLIDVRRCSMKRPLLPQGDYERRPISSACLLPKGSPLQNVSQDQV